MTRLVVKPHSPQRARLNWLLAIALALVSAWGLYSLGHHRAGLDFDSLGQRIGLLLTELDELGEENSRLRGELAIERRSREIELEAYRRLEKSVAELQAEALQGREELAFFRGIVSPLDGNRGLTLQDFSLEPRPQLGDRHWHYKLVLTQVLKNDTVISGKVRFTLKGWSGDKELKIGLKELGASKSSLGFRFKYFQTLEGDIELPEGFRATSLEVMVDPNGKVYKELARNFDWPTEES